jgi:hypothetical protein
MDRCETFRILTADTGRGDLTFPTSAAMGLLGFQTDRATATVARQMALVFTQHIARMV